MLEFNPLWWIPFGFPRKKWFPLSVSSCILIRYRFTNERHSTSIETTDLPLNRGWGEGLLFLFRGDGSRAQK